MTRQLRVSLIALFLVAGQLQAQSPTIENVSPVVVKTTPEAGSSGVEWTLAPRRSMSVSVRR